MKYNYKRREIIIHGFTIELTNRENELLDLIWNKKSKTISYAELNEKLFANIGNNNTANIRILAHRMIDKGVPIQTIWGYGLKIIRGE